VDLTNEQGLASDALGGFSLSTHHVFDPASQTLFGGDGSVTAPDGDRVRRLLGGGSSTMPLLDGATVDPTTIALGYSTGLEFDVGPDGQLYAISGGAFYRLDLRGSATRLSVGPPESAGDNVSGLTVANDGTIYAATSSHVFRFDPTATATERWVIIAGLDWGRTEGDACADQRACVGRAGMTARARSFYRIDDLEWAPDGDLYVAHEFASNESELLVLHPNGTMDSIGGAAAPTRAFVRGSARDVGFGLIEDVAIGRDGSVYIASTNPSTLDTRGATYSRLTKLQADGTIEVIAGGGSDACALSRECDYYAPPGDPAVGFLTIRNVAVSADGTVYLVAAARGVESWVDVDGTIHGVQVFSLRDGSGLEPVLGDGTWGDYEGDPRAARSVPAYGIDNIDVLPDGNLAAAIVGGTYSSPMSLLVSLDGGARTGADGSVYWLARDPSGETRHVFDARGRHLRTERDPEGDLVRRFEYDERGRLVAEVDAYGLRTVIERDAAGVATAVVGPYGHRTELTIERGLLRRVVDPSGAVWTLQWNEAGLLSRFEDPVGAQNDFVYRESGELRSDSHSSGEGWTLESLRADSRIEATLTSREGRSTRYVVETGPSPSRSVIDSSGLVRQSRSGPGWTTTFLAPTGSQTMTELGVDQAWGAMWPLASSRTYSTPSGRTSTRVERTSYTFDGTPAPESVAQRTITSGSAGELWTSTYTEAARTHEIRSPEGRMLVVGLDGQGAAASVAAGSDVPTTFVRDSSGRVQTLSQGARSVAMEYDSDGSLRSVTDAVGATWAMGHDAVGRVVSLTQPSGAVTTLRRDLLGRIVGVTPPGHPEHSFERDARGRLTAEVTPDAGDGRARTVYEHDEDGLLTAIRRADGTSLVYGRDAGGRLVGLGVAEGDYGARYDTTTGNLVSVTNPSGDALTLEWDGDLMTSLSWSGAVSASLSVDYDSALRVSSAQLGSESPVLYRYDRDGLPVRVGAAELTRGADTARPARMTIGDLSFVYDHSEYGEVTRRSTSLAGTTLYEELLTRDAGGRVVGARETVRGAVVSRDYRYDSSGRLERVATGGLETERYRYDANGHREGASVDARDRVTAYVGVTYDYAITGERVRRVEGGRTTEYDYDEQGQLRAVVLSDGRQLTYGIDPQGRRGSRSMDGAVSERYLWAGDRLLAVLEPDGRIRDRFVYAENHVPTYFVRGGRTYAFVTDVRGSVRLVVDAATGAVAQELSYDAFGRVLSDSNPGFQPFGFAAGLYDAATGLVRFGMRDYDPELGEWTAPDPIGFLGGDPNLYRYCGGDPVNLVDPTGLDPAHDAIMEVFENADYSVPGIAGSVATALSGGAALAMFLFFLPEEAVGAAAVVGVWLVRAIMSGLAGWIGSQTGSEVKEMCLSGGLTRRQEEAMRRLAEHYNGAPRPEIRSRINPEGVPGQFPPGAMIGRQVY
jgi:RHS repeat-associated protein